MSLPAALSVGLVIVPPDGRADSVEILRLLRDRSGLATERVCYRMQSGRRPETVAHDVFRRRFERWSAKGEAMEWPA